MMSREWDGNKPGSSRSSGGQMCKHSFTWGLTLQLSVFAFCCRSYLLSHPHHGHKSSFTLVLFLIKLIILLRNLHSCPHFWNLLICKWMRCYPNIPQIGSNHRNDSSFLCLTVTNTKIILHQCFCWVQSHSLLLPAFIRSFLLLRINSNIFKAG